MLSRVPTAHPFPDPGQSSVQLCFKREPIDMHRNRLQGETLHLGHSASPREDYGKGLANRQDLVRAPKGKFCVTNGCGEFAQHSQVSNWASTVLSPGREVTVSSAFWAA